MLDVQLFIHQTMLGAFNDFNERHMKNKLCLSLWLFLAEFLWELSDVASLRFFLLHGIVSFHHFSRVYSWSSIFPDYRGLFWFIESIQNSMTPISWDTQLDLCPLSSHVHWDSLNDVSSPFNSHDLIVNEFDCEQLLIWLLWFHDFQIIFLKF